MEDIKKIDELFSTLESKDNNIRYEAFKELLQITEEKVSWIYDKWFVLVDKLSSDNSFQRSIGLMLLANLSKSDIDNRFGTIMDNYLEYFNDEKFITARQCVQNVWKIAITHEGNKKKIIQQLENAYQDNINLSKHANLFKQDIIGSMYQIYQHTKDGDIKKKIHSLIESEIDAKFVKSLKKIISE